MTYARYEFTQSFQKPAKGLTKIWAGLGLRPLPEISGAEFNSFCKQLEEGLAKERRFSAPVTQVVSADFAQFGITKVSIASGEVSWSRTRDSLHVVLTADKKKIFVAGDIRTPYESHSSEARNKYYARECKDRIFGTLSL